MIVLTYDIVGVHHGHHLLVLQPDLLLAPLPPALALLAGLIVIVKVVFLETESFGAEGHNTEDENYHNEYAGEDNEDDGEGMEV